MVHELARLPFLLAAASLLLASARAQQPAPADTNTGFLDGLRGFEKFHEPLGQPIYFESPFNSSEVRALYVKHDFGGQSFLQGGDVTIYAVQARLAITDRLGFIATKDGYSELDAGALPEDEGWNDLAAGFKYVAVADTAAAFALTPGIRYMAENGHRGILQGGADEVSPFVSAAKGFDRLHLLANATLRVPLDGDEGNTVGHWDLHADYDVNPDSAAVFAPLLEVHGVHYLDDGARWPCRSAGSTTRTSARSRRTASWAGRASAPASSGTRSRSARATSSR